MAGKDGDFWFLTKIEVLNQLVSSDFQYLLWLKCYWWNKLDFGGFL